MSPRTRSIEYTPLTPDRLHDLEAMLLPVWGRRWSPRVADDIFRWRFLERQGGEAVLAYRGARPVACLDSFVRPYRTPAGVVHVREPADWFCAPDHRPLVSIQLMRRLFEKPEPVLVVGGNPGTREILPRLGCQELPALATYVFPLGTGVVAKTLSKRFGVPMTRLSPRVARALSLRLRPTGGLPAPPPEVRVRRIEAGGPVPDFAADGGPHGFAQLFQQWEFDWLRKAPPSMGEFVWLAFEADDGVRGVSLSRVYQEGPFRAARLLHLDATRPSASSYAGMMGETVRLLARSGAQWIGARFSSPLACGALERVGFRRVSRCRAFWWDRAGRVPEGPMHLGWATNDEGLLPYPM